MARKLTAENAKKRVTTIEKTIKDLIQSKVLLENRIKRLEFELLGLKEFVEIIEPTPKETRF